MTPSIRRPQVGGLGSAEPGALTLQNLTITCRTAV
jgi:hypothetical protein